LKNELNIHQVLKVFQTIVKHGEKVAEGHRLDGITALSDFDGYTIVLKDEKVSLALHFHNKYDIQSEHPLDEQAFFAKLQQIDRTKYH
jgi:hypothetical protein